MVDSITLSLHGGRLVLRSNQDDFLTFARAYLNPLLGRPGAGQDIEVALEWGTALPDESRSELEQLGRRIWTGSRQLRFAAVWQMPGLQLDVGWQDESLDVHVVYTWPSWRERWLAAVLSQVQERLFVALIYYLVYFPLTWWLEREQGWTLLHASAFATPEGGIVFSGLPGCGKSTVALAALSGLDGRIISDNLLFTDGRRIYACPEPVHVDARTRALAGTPVGYLRSTGRHFSHRRRDYELAPEVRQSATVPRALGFLRIGRETSIRLMDRTAAMQRLMANDYLAKEWMAYQESAAAMHQVWPSVGDQERRRENLAVLVQAIRCYDVTIARDNSVQRVIKDVVPVMLDG